MSVAQGSFTVGFLGADYVNWRLALADVAATLTGDLTFTQIAVTDEGSTMQLTPSLDLAGHTLKLTADMDHNWRLEAGRVTVLSHIFAYIYTPGIHDLTGGGQLIIEKLNLKATPYSYYPIYIYNAVTTQPFDVIIRDILIDIRGMTAAFNFPQVILICNDNLAVIRWFVSNVLVCGSRAASAGGAAFIINTGLSQEVYLENCVADGATPLGVPSGRGFNFVGAGTKVVRNCVAINSVAGAGFTGKSVARGYNNMSDDTTAEDAGWVLGSGNVPSVTAADEFESLTKVPSDTYLLPKATGNAKDGGSAPIIAGNTYGAVVAIARPHDINKYSIGGKEYPSSPVITAHPTTQTIDEDTAATFAVVATDATGYQWSRKEPDGSVWADVVGATSASYTTPVFGATNHQAQYRCTVSNAAGSVLSTEVYLLFTGWPLPGASGESPERPTVSNVTQNDLTISMDVSGIADVFHAELRMSNSVVMATAEILTRGTLTIQLPTYDLEYTLVVVAGNYGSTHWSLPGYTGVFSAEAVPDPRTPVEVELREVEPMYSDLDADLRIDRQGNLLVVEDEDALDAEIETMFFIEPGELVMDPLYGCDLNRLIGSRNVNNSSASFIRMVLEKTLAEEPRIAVDSVIVEPREDEGEYRISFGYSVNATQQQNEFTRYVSGE